ncbi:MAG: NADH-quinone oxidoreductase subunit M [Anaerolineales bacterium]
MILIYLILWLFFGGLLAWLVSRWRTAWSRWVALFTVSAQLLYLLGFWLRTLRLPNLAASGTWLMEVDLAWIPQLGIHIHLGLDGLSLLMILLTDLLGMMAVVASWKEIQYKAGFFYFNLLWILTALVGVFLALDLFLFYFFWELMLLPLYFLIGIWGHENRIYAARKFFIFTQLGGLLMLVSILGLYFVHGQSTGVYTFDYLQLLGTSLAPTTGFLLMLGFFIAFAVKLPIVPLHTWLPDAHTEAPTAGSIVLAGLILKAAGYGFIRILLPLFPQAARQIAPVAMALGVVGILYAALLAFAQTDLKRLIAYTSVSHMGFVVMGIFAHNQLAMQGAIIIMLAHGISTGMLFFLAGALYERVHTRDLNRLGGLWSTVPRMGRVGLLFALASLGLPGLGNFVGEFLVLLGTYKVNAPVAVFATLGFVVATVYSLLMVQRIFSGPNTEGWKIPDFDRRELAIATLMVLAILGLGLYPDPVLRTSQQAIQSIQQAANQEFHFLVDQTGTAGNIYPGQRADKGSGL